MDRDAQLVFHILKHYSEMLEELSVVHDNFEEFETNMAYNKAIKLDVIEIGEHTSHLSEQRQRQINKTDLRGVIDYRNQVVHGYISIKNKELWKTIHDEMPSFIEQIKKLNII